MVGYRTSTTPKNASIELSVLEVVLPDAVWVALFVLWQREIPSI